MNENMNQRCGILFDLDGVLLDSEGNYSIFWAEMDRKWPTGVPDFAAYIKGFHLGRILAYFPNDDVRQQVLDRLKAFELNMSFDFFPGALDFVQRLHDAGIPMAIVTSSDQKKMQALYNRHPGFPALFDHIVTGDMIGVDIKDCIVFEDSRNGLLAGRNSGARVIGIASTLSVEEVSTMSDLTVLSVSELSVDQIVHVKRK